MIARSPYLSVLAFAAVNASAQGTVPRGTFLPVALTTAINSKKAYPGQGVRAKIMQDVPLPNGSQIPAGSKILGHITAVQDHSGKTGGSSVSLRFDRLQLHNEQVAIVTSLRAIASFMAVHEAQLPLFGSDRGSAENSWTTLQVGGTDVVYRGGGPVRSRFGVAGKPVPGGVLVHPRALPGTPCQGEPDDNDQLQAFWVFSSDACGVYRLTHLTIQHGGRTSPVAEVVLSSSKTPLKLSAGAGMLLQVLAP